MNIFVSSGNKSLFASPYIFDRFRSTYPLNEFCWTFIGKEDYKIEFQFKMFKLEKSINCSKSFLLINEISKERYSPILRRGKFCGKKSPFSMTFYGKAQLKMKAVFSNPENLGFLSTYVLQKRYTFIRSSPSIASSTKNVDSVISLPIVILVMNSVICLILALTIGILCYRYIFKKVAITAENNTRLISQDSTQNGARLSTENPAPYNNNLLTPNSYSTPTNSVIGIERARTRESIRLSINATPREAFTDELPPSYDNAMFTRNNDSPPPIYDEAATPVEDLTRRTSTLHNDSSTV